MCRTRPAAKGAPTKCLILFLSRILNTPSNSRVLYCYLVKLMVRNQRRSAKAQHLCASALNNFYLEVLRLPPFSDRFINQMGTIISFVAAPNEHLGVTSCRFWVCAGLKAVTLLWCVTKFFLLCAITRFIVLHVCQCQISHVGELISVIIEFIHCTS